MMQKIGFGGSCHWCTEAIFRSLRGVVVVEQGWISSEGAHAAFSEGVIVHFDKEIISLETLIAIHLYTHSCTSLHSMRAKYRSAVYVFEYRQAAEAAKAIDELQTEFGERIITQVLPFMDFRLNEDQYLDYYYKDPSKPFCENVVSPKLRILLERFGGQLAEGRLDHLKER